MLALLLAVINLSNADPNPVKLPPAHIGDRVVGPIDMQGPFSSTSMSSDTLTACSSGDPRLITHSFDTSSVLRPAIPPCPNTSDGHFTNSPFGIVPESLRASLLPEFAQSVPVPRFGVGIAPGFSHVVPAPGQIPLSRVMPATPHLAPRSR